MRQGEIVGERFELERSVGIGGMGEVFRARDRATGGLVAVKLLHSRSQHDTARFEREARIVSELSHPGIARYVAHGVIAGGMPFLAMEWLQGEDLRARLLRSRLTVLESATIVERVAEVLAVVHAKGVVHRDLKPSNIFLLGSSPEHVKLLDFGIARLEDGTVLTRSATTIGTPGYMAPEQARGEAVIDARADVFALGCVLFECLTGVAAFSGPNVMVILAKILLDDVPLVTGLCPDAPPDLATLCAQMLSKNAAERPRNGAAVAAALKAIGTAIADGAQATEPHAALTGGEQRLVSAVMVSPPRRVSEGDSATLAQTVSLIMSDELRRVVLDHGGRLEVLADGSAVVVITGVHNATDQAARAARCAISLRELSEGRPVAIATGSGELSGRAPISAVLERAGILLAACELPAASPSDSGTPPIVVDDVTAGLLNGRFDVRASEQGFELVAERTEQITSRTLLGKPTACVGRERELAALGALLDECLQEPVAQAVIVTAPPGIGKSRLANELVRSLNRRGEPIDVWIGRGDSLRAGATLGMLRQALEAVFGMQGGDSQEARRKKLRARVDKHVEPADRRRVTEFLGEILDATLPDDNSVPLRAARLDVQLMSDQMRRAWEDFCAAECAAHPILLVLEDLHWGDLVTVRFVDAALKRLSKSPFMVLALARPEVHELFPNLWANRGAQQIRLKALSQRASEELVRQVLGDHVDREIAQRIAVIADGNAFFLEELIRAAAEGKQAALPGTVVAIVQARLETLEAEARQVLRAASVFGELLWQGGVEALLPGPAAAQWLPKLAERELLVRRRSSRFQGEQELSFRHALIREAAYAMLTPSDRETGHRLAGEWLERHGEPDALMLAEHFERGKLLSQAGIHYAHATAQAIRSADTEGTIARAKRGLECGVPDDARVMLLRLLCEVHCFRNEHSLVVPDADEALRLAPAGSEAWAWATAVKLGAASMTGDVDGLLALCRSMRDITPAPGAVGVVSLSVACAMYWLDVMDRPDLAQICLTQACEIAEPFAAADPLARGFVNIGKGAHAFLAQEDPWTAFQATSVALASFLEIGHALHVKGAQCFRGIAASMLGDFETAERNLREAIAGLDHPYPLSMNAMLSLIELLAQRGALDQAQEQATRALMLSRASPMPPDEGRARWGMAIVLLRRGELAAAEREALAAQESLALVPLERAALTATLAAIWLAQGRAAEALAALQPLTPRFRASLTRLVHAEALHATGDLQGAREAIAAARARVLSIAATIEDASYRRSYLENVPEVARTLTLAREWLE